MDQQAQAILLLAAGRSRRMGQPKQLLTYEGQPLIVHLLRLLCAQQRPVYVVLGAFAEQVSAAISAFPVQQVRNPAWERGMGTSLRRGLEVMLRQEQPLEQVLCCVVDQVFLSQAVLDQFWNLAPAHQLIAASYASGEVGVPALFGKPFFAELLALEDRQGAKPLLGRHASELQLITFPEGDFDLDYPADWELFLEKRAGNAPSQD